MFHPKYLLVSGSGTTIEKEKSLMDTEMNETDRLREIALGLISAGTDERAVLALLKPPALSYTRDLRYSVEQDADFLASNERSVRPRILRYLAVQGIFWDEEIFNRQYKEIVMKAIAGLKKSEM